MKGHHTTLGTPLESLGLVTRISPLDFFEFVDSVAEIVSRCSFSIIREFTGSPRLIKTVVIAMVYSHCHPHHHKWDIPIRSVAALLFCKFASSSSSFACLSNQIMQVSQPCGSWVVFAVRVQGSILNPSPPFLLNTISPLKGCFGLCDFQVGMGYRGNGLWEMVRGELGDVLGGWFGARNRGRGWFEVGGKGVRVRLWLQGLKEKYGEEAKMAPHFSFSCHSFLSRVLVINYVWKVTALVPVVL
ncbi:hypothetical protein Tco_0670791 [Tanacetum coccineum]